MSAKKRSVGALMLMLLAATLGRAEAPKDLPYLAPSGSKPAISVMPEPTLAQAPATTQTPPPVQAYAPDNWVYTQQPPDCCPALFSGPIGTELYFRSGASIPIAGSDFKKALRTGWEFMGGGRTLFFNPDASSAWVVDLGASYTINDGYPSRTFLYRNGAPVTIRNLHRTAVSLGLGHEWFLFGPGATGHNDGTNWRYGFDGGARWGTAHIDLNPVSNPGGYARQHDVYGAAYAAIHANCEVPMGGWTLLVGVRGEWAYSFMDLLPAQNTHLQDINALLTIGARW